MIPEHPLSPPPETTGAPLVSVVLCTYRRPAQLWDALVSLSRQEPAGPFEVVVVDNDKEESGRKTAERARSELFSGIANLSYVVERGRTSALPATPALPRHTGR